MVTDKLRGHVVRGSLFEVNYISNLSPNHTLELTTLRTSVRSHYNYTSNIIMILLCMVILSLMFSGYYLRDGGCYCMLFDNSRCDPSY